jgi:three-Cys-motif partner protein
MFWNEKHYKRGRPLAGGTFFDERSDQSEIKARIVQKYFFAWARVIMPSARSRPGKIAYIDLYAGPGRYKDGAASTPLLVLEGAIADPAISQMLVTLFNDADADHSATLQSEINKLSGIDKLKYKPKVMCSEVDKTAEQYFIETRLVPAFTFVDPYGYLGLSLQIVNGVTKDWGCDCVFFFNYNRINAGISNPAVQRHIDALFGTQRAGELRRRLPSMTPSEREASVLEELAQAIKAMGGKYVLPFRFRNAAGTRTSHSLIFVSKHLKGYEIMKDIMSRESSIIDQGVPSFTYSPADASMPLLFSLSRPLDALEGMLIENFHGKHLSMLDIYQQHNVDTPYIKKNYKDALMRLEASEQVVAAPAAQARRKSTFADGVMVKFPR